MQPVIVTTKLSKRFHDTVALDALDLTVPAGTVFGFLGPNGAGKSTTIRLLMGLIRPTSGSATVLGHDIATAREKIHARVGYLPGDFTAYRDLTGTQYLSFLANQRSGVDPDEVRRLADRFELDLDRRVGTLSHGGRQKVGIVQACMHRPELLIFDEPTSGLDPLMQRQFLDLVREYRDDGRTVFLSSHVLSEVEEVADVVAIIRKGKLVITSDVREIKARTQRRVALTFAPGTVPPIADIEAVANVRSLDVAGGTVLVVVEGSMADLLRITAPHGIDRIVSDEVDLEGVFLRYYGDEEPAA